MEIPTKLWYHEAEYQRWWLLNNKIKKETRLLFRRATKLKTNNKLINYGMDWKSIVDTLKPFPYNIEAYHIDHIIPLNEFNFIHEDESINLTELKKAEATKRAKPIIHQTFLGLLVLFFLSNNLLNPSQPSNFK